MVNHKYSRCVAEVIPAVAFNVVFFLLAEDFSTAKWIGWCCLNTAYFVFVMVLRWVSAGNRGTVFGYPKAGVAFLMLVATAMAFVSICVARPESAKWAVIIEVVTTAGLCSLLFALDATEDETRCNEERVRKDYAFIATAAQIIDEARRSISDAALNKSIEKAYDAVRNGNVMSVKDAAETESAIMSMACRLKEITPHSSMRDEAFTLAKRIAVEMRTRETIIRNSRCL